MIARADGLKVEFSEWGRGWAYFAERHLTTFGIRFESRKDLLVDILMARRGSYQRPFLHASLIVLIVTGVSSAPILASAYSSSTRAEFTPPSAVLTSLDVGSAIQTEVSEKPRDQVIQYAVQSGDTISKIAQQFGISVDTVKWANDIKSDSLSIGQSLKIPPVTGIVVKVKDGETVYSIAKKYKSDAQNIVNFPFNEFADPETFALNVGQTLIVPGGVEPEAPAIAPQAPVFVDSSGAQGTGQFLWPTVGVVTQYPSWYHMAFDIANPAAPAIMAADSGIVTLVQYLKYDYGQHVIISHGNGMSTLYGHMQAIYVKPGDRVNRGQVIGKMGSTGRSTGTHLHFEIRQNGTTVNPAAYFK
jgi:murein DD-endopeptidase MepM/ murein hydrolase activator NlpD